MSQQWVDAQNHLAGGVNSPVRAFRAVGGEPVFMKSGKGAELTDTAGKKYVDYCMSWGALYFGHADPVTVKAVQAQAKKGLSFGACTTLETELATEIQKVFPNMERIRFTSSGTEAVMSAIRLARGFTKKERVVKFEGCYHGHADSLLVKAGSGLATFGTPDSGGIPKELAKLTTVLEYNNSDAVRAHFRKSKDTACVIVEPVAGNMGVVPGKTEFLETLKKECKKAGALLIFDEVMSGFRVAYGGAQHLHGITPDMVVLGKVIGGGLPVGAFGARREIMENLSPLGAVYQAGTLSGNPLSMAAGLSVLKRLSKKNHNDAEKKQKTLLAGAQEIFARKKIEVVIQSVGLMFTVFFRSGKVENWNDVSRSDKEAFKKYFNRMLAAGIYLPPSAFEAAFFSQAHGKNEIEKTLKAIERC